MGKHSKPTKPVIVRVIQFFDIKGADKK